MKSNKRTQSKSKIISASEIDIYSNLPDPYTNVPDPYQSPKPKKDTTNK